jgi:hypothetical protein
VVLALRYLRGASPRRPVFGIVHGVVGVAALALLVMSLQGPRHGDAMGVGSFGLAASVLFAIALTIGLCIPLLATRSLRVTGAVIAAHASLAVTAYVLFLAWASL